METDNSSRDQIGALEMENLNLKKALQADKGSVSVKRLKASQACFSPWCQPGLQSFEELSPHHSNNETPLSDNLFIMCNILYNIFLTFWCGGGGAGLQPVSNFS